MTIEPQNESVPLRVSVLGSGRRADGWRSALADSASLAYSIDASTDAVVIAPGSHDPFSLTREALGAGAAVLFAAPFQLSPWQARSLERLSSREKRILRFVEPFRYQRAFPFLQRLLEGREPFWRPLYVRSLYLRAPDSGLRLDEMATEELALYDSLLGAAPRAVSAISVGQDQSTQTCAVSLTVEYDDGPAFHSMFSLVEGSAAHELVAVAPERTVLLDQLDRETPLRILGTGVDGHELSLAGDAPGGFDNPTRREAMAFLRAVSGRDLSHTNASRWTRVASVWWAARQSMSFGGSVEVPAPMHRNTEPPALKVIEGGGMSRKAPRRRRTLTLVAN